MLVTQSCPILCDAMDCSPPGSSVQEISQVRILEWVAISFSRAPSRPRDRTQVSCTAGRFFTDWATREAQFLNSTFIFYFVVLALLLEYFLPLIYVTLVLWLLKPSLWVLPTHLQSPRISTWSTNYGVCRCDDMWYVHQANPTTSFKVRQSSLDFHFLLAQCFV